MHFCVTPNLMMSEATRRKVIARVNQGLRDKVLSTLEDRMELLNNLDKLVEIVNTMKQET